MDSTLVLRSCLDLELPYTVFYAIYDPVSVDMMFDAGEGSIYLSIYLSTYIYIYIYVTITITITITIIMMIDIIDITIHIIIHIIVTIIIIFRQSSITLTWRQIEDA